MGEFTTAFPDKELKNQPRGCLGPEAASNAIRQCQLALGNAIVAESVRGWPWLEARFFAPFNPGDEARVPSGSQSPLARWGYEYWSVGDPVPRPQQHQIQVKFRFQLLMIPCGISAVRNADAELQC
jgi:hypothetical protein